MRKRLYLDRFEGELAVVSPEGSDNEENIPKLKLPSNAREGDWLICDLSGGDANYRLDASGTEEAKQRVQGLMDELGG